MSQALRSITIQRVFLPPVLPLDPFVVTQVSRIINSTRTDKIDEAVYLERQDFSVCPFSTHVDCQPKSLNHDDGGAAELLVNL